MSKLWRFLTLTVATSGLAVVAMGAGAGAGAGPVPVLAAPLTILKTVSGPVPAGTSFTATIHCDAAIIDDGEDGVDTATVEFDATGQPTTVDTIGFGDPGTCTVTETVTGGATTTTYVCAGSVQDSSATGRFGSNAVLPEDPICPTAGPQADPITVNINQPDQTVTVTIANTFVAPTPTPAPVAEAVAVAPAFTG